MKIKKKEILTGLDKLLNAHKKNLTKKQKELICLTQERVRNSATTQEILVWILKLATALAGVANLKDLI